MIFKCRDEKAGVRQADRREYILIAFKEVASSCGTVPVRIRWSVHVFPVNKIWEKFCTSGKSLVTVEVERYSSDLSSFSFVALPGRLEGVQDPETRSLVREKFVELIKKNNLSSNVLSALRHSRMSHWRHCSLKAQQRWMLTGVETGNIST